MCVCVCVCVCVQDSGQGIKEHCYMLKLLMSP